jgi:predicted ester cyclase
MSMQRRGVYPMTIALAVITALTLVYSASSVKQQPSVGTAAIGSQTTVRAFYDAFNDAIRLGDMSDLTHITAPAITVHRTGGDTPQRRDEFLKHVGDLGAAYPQLAIDLEDVMADRDRVVARISVHGAETMGLLGIPSPSPGSRDGKLTEVFRVLNGQVVEYRGLIADFDAPRQVVQATMTTGPIQTVAAGIARLTLQPNTHIPDLLTIGPTIYVMEAGALTFQVQARALKTPVTSIGERTQTERIEPGEAGMLNQGDQLAIEAGAPYSIGAAGHERAVVLVATLMHPELLDPPTAEGAHIASVSQRNVMMFLVDTTRQRLAIWPAGVDSQPLLRDAKLTLPRSSISLVLWSVTIAPGMAVSGPPPEGSADLLVVSGDALLRQNDEESDDGNAAVVKHPTSNVIAITTGRSADLNPSTSVTLWNIGHEPLAVLILSITRNDGPSTLTVPLTAAQ